ncbi:MAG: type I restriction enzyme HsdR N-terminal domain-containing protein [Candidatus Fimenecus sp.]
MIKINAKISERISKNLKKYQPILRKAKEADINESDTVTIITDMFCDILGYDKYENLTSEYAIKKTFCDLAVTLNGSVPILIECKAIGLDLKEDHVRQATNYSANSGIEWVVLTNGLDWKIYKVLFTKPVEKVLVYEFNIDELSPRKPQDIEFLYYLCIEAFPKNKKPLLDELYSQKQIFNRYNIGRLLLTDKMIGSLKSTSKKFFPDIRIDNDDLIKMLTNEVLKREITEGEAADKAKKDITKIEKTITSKKKSEKS